MALAAAVAPTPVPLEKPAACVSFSAEIAPFTTESLIAQVSTLVNQKVKTIYLLLSTPGGRVDCGINLYNFLRGLPVTLITHNMGNVDSIGNAVFLAGGTRYACPQSTFMFHGVGFDGQAGTRFDERALREKHESVRADQTRIGEILMSQTGLDRASVDGFFSDARTMNATDAVRLGIVHEMRDFNLPPGVPVYSLVFKR
jgi:ATP-dependent protease ClpP protease subunit